VKVVRTALQDAASVAGLLVTTEAMVAEKPKKETAPAMPPGGGMDYCSLGPLLGGPERDFGGGHPLLRPAPMQQHHLGGSSLPRETESIPPHRC
jgi:hypothetical protein